ncbi:hypothetical protein SVA_0079 [Sulfurifustis variabilis]|uniref:Transporter n=1 Tax=Sulfurifustis variabilis TaxID=1675686 RepID=A0A1B4VA37_9GAMM|nr:TolC family protein [Sulfurifustis variabilis]BAU46661.1 hypothetical protein SVA_0079 [Sulfurifustis variabilis]
MGPRLPLLLILLAPALAGAQPLSVEQAVAHALERNPELRAVAAGRRAAAAQAAAAESGRQPEINLRYMARRSDNPLDAFADKLNTRTVTAPDFDPASLNDPDPSTLHATELSLMWPVYTGGRVQAGIAGAAAQESAAELQLRRARETVATQARNAVYAAQAAAEAVRIMDDAVRAAERHAQTTARLLRERRIVQSDKLSADVNLALVQSNREQAVARARNALTQLRRVMGLPPDEAIELAPLADAAEIRPGDAAALERQSQERRADVRAAAAVRDAARTEVDSARAAYRPQVSVGAAQSWYDDSPALANSATSVMGVVSMNLYNGRRTGHQISAAEAGQAAAEARLDAVKQQAAAEVRAALHALEEARRRVEICADNVGKARRTADLVRGRYGEGRTILIDLLQAERVLVEARMEKLNASAGLLAAQANLALATGAVELPE